VDELLEIISVDFDIVITNQIFCIHQILEGKWEYRETVHHLTQEISTDSGIPVKPFD
jgi:hypothetical protein